MAASTHPSRRLPAWCLSRLISIRHCYTCRCKFLAFSLDSKVEGIELKPLCSLHRLTYSHALTQINMRGVDQPYQDLTQSTRAFSIYKLFCIRKLYVHIRVNANQSSVVLGLAPFETYYNRFINSVQCQLAWFADKATSRQCSTNLTADKEGPRQTAYCDQCTSLTYSDCSIGLGFIGTDCNMLERGGG